jgi:hypothetical protein
VHQCVESTDIKPLIVNIDSFNLPKNLIKRRQLRNQPVKSRALRGITIRRDESLINKEPITKATKPKYKLSTYVGIQQGDEYTVLGAN